MPVDPNRFLAGVSRLFGGTIKTPQQAGLIAILSDWEARAPQGDPRWLAYMLATAFHETARTMQPVKEAYWLSEDWRRLHLKYYPYYGRGYVQLTWPFNYAKAGSAIGVDLLHHLDLALDPKNAAAIMYFGMTEGWFRGDGHGRHNSLQRYFNHTTDDPVGAREIINGPEWVTVNNQRTLLAEVIARYYRAFLAALTPQAVVAAPAAAPATAQGGTVAMEAAAFTRPASPAMPDGWVLYVKRLRQERRPGEGFDRTVGTYTVLHGGVSMGISGNTVERQGPGDNGPAGKASHTCIKAGSYPLRTHATLKYATLRFETNGRHPRPAIEVGATGARVGILIHPADGYGSTIGCINLAGDLVNEDSNILLPDSIARVVAVINDLKSFDAAGMPGGADATIRSAHLVIEDF